MTDIEEFFLHLCHFEAVTDIEELSPKNKATSPRLSILCLEYIFFFLHLCSSLKKIILAHKASSILDYNTQICQSINAVIIKTL